MAYIKKEPLCAWLEHMGVSRYIIDTIKNEEHFPNADVVEVKHGEWITDENGVVICSECGEEHEWQDFRPPYCDMCGSKMDGERK
ncbi:MAG: hypothetical protein UIM24_05595 [Clostridia bacterium]|nr:hypothetical protein [Clostridia bacterium]